MGPGMIEADTYYIGQLNTYIPQGSWGRTWGGS